MRCRKNKPSKVIAWVQRTIRDAVHPKDKSLEDDLRSIGSRGCMAFVLQNTVDPPICHLFEASLPCRFLLTFPLLPFLAKWWVSPARAVLDEVQDQLSQISSIPDSPKSAMSLSKVCIYKSLTQQWESFRHLSPIFRKLTNKSEGTSTVDRGYETRCYGNTPRRI